MKNTTSEVPSTTSSGPTGESKPWRTVVALGHRLERELGVAGSRDTLARWMAHRIAELMQRVKTARTPVEREAAKTTCVDTILKLWQSRTHLPAGAPLAPFADFLENFVKEPNRYSPLEITDDPKTWSQALPDALRLLERELSLWREAALAEQPHDTAQQTVQALGAELGSEEVRILQSLAEAQNRIEAVRAAVFGDFGRQPGKVTPTKRNRAFRKAITELNQCRAKLFASIMRSQRAGKRK